VSLPGQHIGVCEQQFRTVCHSPPDKRGCIF
jgi:hypothetical protein